MATKIITKEFSFDVIAKLEHEKGSSNLKLIGIKLVFAGLNEYNDIYKVTFTEPGQNSKYAWAVYVEDGYLGNWVPAGITSTGDFVSIYDEFKHPTITAALVTLKPVPTWLPVYDDEISTNTINELLTGST